MWGARWVRQPLQPLAPLARAALALAACKQRGMRAHTLLCAVPHCAQVLRSRDSHGRCVRVCRQQAAAVAARRACKRQSARPCRCRQVRTCCRRAAAPHRPDPQRRGGARRDGAAIPSQRVRLHGSPGVRQQVGGVLRGTLGGVGRQPRRCSCRQPSFTAHLLLLQHAPLIACLVRCRWRVGAVQRQHARWQRAGRRQWQRCAAGRDRLCGRGVCLPVAAGGGGQAGGAADRAASEQQHRGAAAHTGGLPSAAADVCV